MFAPPSAILARRKQLELWEESDMNKVNASPRKADRVKFPSDVHFFAACSNSELDDVQHLLDNGVDINSVNVDGLTALHQACIDNDYELVKFLIERNANVNAQDYEGWTPLHASASCGYIEIVKILLDNGADTGIVSFEVELPVDVAQGSGTVPLLKEAMEKQAVDPGAARNMEENRMLEDVKKWLHSDEFPLVIDPRTGATALHVAAAKDYAGVLELLLKVPGVDMNVVDNDGWTPLHAAAHWARERALRLLAGAGASFEKITLTNQSIFDVSDESVIMLLRTLRENQRIAKMKAQPNEAESTEAVKRKTDNPEEGNGSIQEAKKQHTEEDEESIKPVFVSAEKAESIVVINSPESSDRVTSYSVIEANGLERPALNSVDVLPRLDTPLPETVDTPEEVSKEEAHREASVDAAPSECQNSDPLAEAASRHSPDEPICGSIQPEKPAIDTKVRDSGEYLPSSNHQSGRRNLPPDPIESTNKINATIKSRLSAVLAPVRCEETETQRSTKARLVRSTRRSTQGITNDVLEAAKRLSSEPLAEPPGAERLGANKSNADQLSAPGTAETTFRPSRRSLIALDTPSIAKPPSEVETILTNTVPVSSVTSTVSPPRTASSNIRTSGIVPSSSDDTPTVIRSRRLTRERVPTGKINTSDVVEALNHLQTTDQVVPNTTSATYTSQDPPTQIIDSQFIPRPSRFLRSTIGKPSSNTSNGERIMPQKVSSYVSSGTTTPLTSSTTDSSRRDRYNWRENINYRRLYEEERCEKERLQKAYDQKYKELLTIRSELARLQPDNPSIIVLRNSSLSGSTSPTSLQKRVDYFEEQVKEITRLREENAKMRNDNRSLIRVISKLGVRFNVDEEDPHAVQKR